MFNVCILIDEEMGVDKKSHIMNVAINLFADRGFEGTSIRDLALEASVNVAMVNYYFGSKEKLVEAIIEEKALYMKDRIEELESNSTLSDIQKIDALIEDYVTRILTGASFHKFLHKELMDTKREEIHQFLSNAFAKNTKNFAAIIDNGIKKGEFKPVDSTMTVISIIGTINQVMLSKNMCNLIFSNNADSNLYTEDGFKDRLLKHIKTMVHHHLLEQI